MQVKSIGDLAPGMKVARDTYTQNGLLLINAGEVINTEVISTLRKNAVSYVFVEEETTQSAPAPFEDEGESYYERIQTSEDFKEFRMKFVGGMTATQAEFNGILQGNLNKDIADSTMEVLHGMDMPEGSTPIFDLMSNMRKYDDAIYAHSVNVALLAMVLARWLDFSEEDVALAGQCGLLHDIGKTQIPPEVLNKPGKLTPEEFAMIKTHPMSGHAILEGHGLDEHIMRAVMEHHEKSDGSGYPMGLRGEDIDPFARLITVVDVYDAITSARKHRGNVCPFKVIEIFEDEGIQKYDTKYYRTFLEHIANNFIGNRCRLSDGREAKIVMTNSVHYSQPMVVAGGEFIDLHKRKDLSIEEML